tara:strand:- start:86 stop:733 length:648 start_codon:yes stop_codon:yes gene_type:complete
MMGKKTQNIAIIDYGMGNLHSVSKALQRVSPEAKVLITSDAKIINTADRIVFPGVGAIGDCMTEIIRLELDNTLAAAVRNKPVLAICVGMQALMKHSEESGGVECLGFLPGNVKRFRGEITEGPRLKVPHMGWNEVYQTKSHALWRGIEQNSRMYFVHSYYVEVENSALNAGVCNYGVPFSAAVACENLFAVQFHPEKSAGDGLQMLENFAHWDI